MIGFFRKIRKKLADDNQFFKYSRYAIGEVVLVVIGILIALQINTWNIERINRLEEKEYLNRMVLDLNRDLVNILSCRERYEERLLVGIQILDSLGNNYADRFKLNDNYTTALKKHIAGKFMIPKNMGEKFFNTLRINFFYKSDFAFQELLSTGKIDIIKNQELKAAIQEHYLKIMDNQNFQDRIVMSIQENFRDALNINNISMQNNESYADLKNKFIDTQGLIVALENHMFITHVMLNILIYDDNSMKKRTENIISQIKEELDNAK